MRARELRDVIEVLIVPSLYGALRELTSKRGSRRKARLLVKQSLDQLRGMMAPPEPASGIDCDRTPASPPLGQMPPVLKTGERLPLDALEGRLHESETGEVRLSPMFRGPPGEADPASAKSTPPTQEHIFDHDQTTDGFGICRCGVVEDSEESAKACRAEPAGV